MGAFALRGVPRAKFLSACAVGAIVSGTGVGHAQVAGDPAEATTSSQLADIVVTAERRATSLQDTPISIVALTEEALAERGIEDLQDLSNFTPNLTISPVRGNGNGQPNFSIRGISGGNTATSERGVGLYIDGIYVPRTSGSVLRVLDVDRVEVLRGPQGTLFGRNSTGGAIRIFTKQPAPDFDAYVRVTAGSFDRSDITGMINLPLGETFSVRLQGAYLNQDGYVRRGGQMLGGQKDYIGRAAARWTPSDSFRATLAFLYSDSKQDGTPLVFREFDMRPGVEGVIQGNFADWINDSFKRAGQPPLAAYNDPRIVKGRFDAPDICLLDDFNPDYDRACDQFNDNKYRQLDLSLEYDLSEAVKLTSLSGYSKLNHNAVSDFQLLGTEFRADVQNSETLYQELQLNAALFDKAIDLVTGVNYFQEKVDSPGYILNRRGTSVFPSGPQQAARNFNINNFAFGDNDAGLFRLADTVTDQKATSYGIFLNATWHTTDKLNLTGGLRYSHDKKDYRQTRFRAADFTPAPGTNSTSVSSDAGFSQLDYRATIDYHFSRDAMVYATTSKAYKAGQFSYTVIAGIPGPQQSGDFIAPVPPEKVVNYEIGSRLELFDRHVRFNPTAFYMQYTNRQAARQVSCAALGTALCPVGFNILIVNSGDVDIYGGELDMQIVVNEHLSFDASAAVIDYKLKDPVANSGPNLYPDAPSPTFTLGTTYTTQIAGGTGTFNLNYAYIGKQATHPTDVGDSAYDLPAYGLLNARLQFIPENKKVTLALFVNNVLDNTFSTYAQRFGGGFWDAGGPPTPLSAPTRNGLAEVRGRPREAGVTLQYNF
ncbi:MAG: hypothetical protein JWM38_837 [Sphingomonas bacterium]|nr:hypothetical protein [Sphingomonas bacterium]